MVFKSLCYERNLCCRQTERTFGCIFLVRVLGIYTLNIDTMYEKNAMNKINTEVDEALIG